MTGPGSDVGGGDHLLGGGREPHAVHDRVTEPGEPGGDGVGVDRIAVAGDGSESAHVAGRGDGGLTQQLAGGLLFGVGGAAGAGRIGEFGRSEAATDGEAFGQVRNGAPPAVMSTLTSMTRPTSASLRRGPPSPPDRQRWWGSGR